MEIEFIKAAISRKTGVPVNLLDGQTVEEIEARASALLSFRKADQAEPKQSAREKFSEYLIAHLGGDLPAVAEPPAYYAQTVDQVPRPSYPVLQDGGSPYMGPDPEYIGSPREQFAQFFAENTAYNPFMGQAAGLQ